MNSDQKQRAANYVLVQMSQRGWDQGDLALRSALDPATVRTFLRGETWPQSKKRRAIEDALEVGRGTLELVARGVAGDFEPELKGDPVERAINESELTRANKAKLIGAYYEMLDGQQEVRGA